MRIFQAEGTERLETVVFATDFSESSENAGRYARALARRMHASLVAMHAFYLEQGALEAEVFSHLVSRQRVHLREQIEEVASGLASGGGLTEALLVEGDPRLLVPQIAAERQPALIVMGTHGGGAMERFVIGSTAEGILRHTPAPALSVGPRTPLLRDETLELKRILFVTNNAAGAAATAQLALDAAVAFGAALDVLNIIHPKSVDGTLNEPHELYARHDETEAALPEHAHALVDLRTFVSVGQPRTEILKHLREREIDLLVMSLNAETQLEMQGNLSGAFPIIAEAICPVLTQVAITPSEPGGN